MWGRVLRRDLPPRFARVASLWVLLAVAAALGGAALFPVQDRLSGSFRLIAGPDGALEAEITLPERGSGPLAPGQRARLSHERWPAERYGYSLAVLGEPQVEGAGVRVSATLIAERGPGDAEHPLLAGGTGTATVILGERSLLWWVLGGG